jgi:hypothetical protein
MTAITKPKTIGSNYKTVLTAVEKLSPEEKQKLKNELFGLDAIAEMKSFEKEMSSKRKPIKKTDAQIVKIINTIRKNRAYANSK